MNDETALAVLPRYDRMRIAVRDCVSVDEAKDIKDRAAALAHYARQRDDIELEAWVGEIRLRACIRIGELSRELETGHKVGQGDKVQIPSSGKLKAEALAEAGISTSTAARYEELAGGQEEQGIAAASAATEAYFARSQQDGQPPTMDGLRGAIRDALMQTLGPPPERRIRQKHEDPGPVIEAFDLFCAAIHTIAKTPEEYHAGFAGQAEPALVHYHRDLACQALHLVASFITGLERRDSNAA